MIGDAETIADHVCLRRIAHVADQVRSLLFPVISTRSGELTRNAIHNKTDTLKPNQKLAPALPAPPVITSLA